MSEFQLPTEKVAAVRQSPRTMILYAPPKMGKTTMISHLDNCLILDLEKGTDMIDALKVDVSEMPKAKESGNVLAGLNELLAQIIEKGRPYEYGAVDTVSALEDLCMPLAKALYRDTPMGKNFDKNNEGKLITELPNGAGYMWLRIAFLKVCDAIEKAFPKVIYVAHLKEKLIETKEGKEVSVNDISLTGRLKSILSARCDAIGYLHRDKDNTMLNFKSSENNVCVGARSEHLRGQDIVLAVSEGAKINSTHWDRIFVD
jgi:hypothetical protein